MSLNGMFNAEWNYKKIKKTEIIIIIDNFHSYVLFFVFFCCFFCFVLFFFLSEELISGVTGLPA